MKNEAFERILEHPALVKLGVIALAIACIVFGGLTAKKVFTSMREKRIDNSLDGLVAEHLGLEAVGLGAFVFFFGFGLLYMLRWL